MKTICTLSAVVFLGIYTLVAQTVTIRPVTEFIIDRDLKGIQTVLYIDEKHVTRGWKDFLKEYGKVESPKGTKNVYSVALAKMPNVAFAPVVITSRITASNGAATIFYAIRDGDRFITDTTSSKYPIPRDLLHDFGVRMYREQVNREIEDAQKELDKRIRVNIQLVKKGESLQKDLEQNGKDRISYEEQLVKNQNDSIQLVRDIATNREQQQQTAQALEKQRLMMTTLKESMDKAGIIYTGKKKKDMPPELQAAEKELKDREREHEKALKTGESLRRDVERNNRQKTDLQSKLVKNAAEKEQIPKEIEANQREQKEAQGNIDKHRQVVEQVRTKLNEIK